VLIACGGGTYIRSIARDLGAALDTGGTLAALIRTNSSGFQLTESLTLEDLAEKLEADCFSPIPPTAALPHLPIVTVSEALTQRWRQGQRLNWLDLLDLTQANQQLDFALLCQTPCQVERSDGDYLGIGQVANSETGEIMLIPKLVWD